MLNDNIIFISVIIILTLGGILFQYKNELNKIYKKSKK